MKPKKRLSAKDLEAAKKMARAAAKEFAKWPNFGKGHPPGFDVDDDNEYLFSLPGDEPKKKRQAVKPKGLKCFVLAYTDKTLGAYPAEDNYSTVVLAVIYAKDKESAKKKLEEHYNRHYEKTGNHLWAGVDHSDFKPYLHEVPVIPQKREQSFRHRPPKAKLPKKLRNKNTKDLAPGLDPDELERKW
jgi:hypothetical protein